MSACARACCVSPPPAGAGLLAHTGRVVAFSAGNVFVDGGSAVYPPGNWFPANWSSVEFRDFRNGDGGNYQLLPNSPYYAPSPGPDIKALNSKTSGVSQW